MLKEISFASIALLLACSGSNHPVSGSYVRFVVPERHTTLSGLADVLVEVSVPESITKYEFGVEGQGLTSFSSVSNTLGLNTTSIPNGRATLIFNATGVSGQQWVDTVEVDIRNATHQLLNYRSSSQIYAKGEQVVLDLTYPVPGLDISADFAKFDDHFDESGVTATDNGGGNYRLQYRISSDDMVTPGEHPVDLIAVNSVGERVTTPIALKLRERPRLPLEIPGATFVDDDTAPVMLVAGAPSIQSVSGAKQIISGVPANLEIRWDQSSEEPVDRVVVRSPDYSGYLVLPVDGATSQTTTLSLHLAPMPTDTTIDQGTLNLLLGAIDQFGATNSWTPATLAEHALEPFGTLVTLWWDNPMDLDLEVKTPQGNTISYNQRSADGGTLELDSDAMCNIDYLNTERISWPLGAAASGTYTVTAKLYGACDQSQTNFHVLVSVCGRLQEYSGTFNAIDSGTPGATQRVGSFDVDCAKRSHGTVFFAHAKALAGEELIPAAYVPVRAVAGSGSSSTVWGQGTTNADGLFDFYLQPAAPDEYRIEVEASWTPPDRTTPLAKVVTQPGGKLHIAGFVAIPELQRSIGGQTLIVEPDESYGGQNDGAGAFNILDKLRRGYAWVSGHLSATAARKVAPIKAHWSSGVAAPDEKFGGSYYNNDDNIYIGGLASDRGEFDDPVVAHEFMHHVTLHVMGWAPGGPHTFEKRTTPALAWNEGIATAFGQQALGSPVYYDINQNWNYFFNLEQSYPLFGSKVAFADRGTSDGTMSGDVGETLVAMVLWDLLDPWGDSTDMFDTIESTYAQTLASVTQYLPRQNRANRGAWSMDLVDFLDGWRCQWPTLTQRDSDLMQLLMDRIFLYDFSLGLQCK